MLSSDHGNEILAPVGLLKVGAYVLQLFVGQNVFSMTVFLFTDYVTPRWAYKAGLNTQGGTRAEPGR